MNIAYLNGIAYIEPDTHVGEWVKKHQRLDCYPGYFERIAPYVKEGGTVIDAGAYIGDHTIAYCSMVGPTGRVIAFEPNPMPFECLCHNVPQAINVRTGLANRPGVIGMVDESNVASSWASWVTQGSITSTATICLDDLGLNRVDFIKLDVEGFEFMALEGARTTIKKHRPMMLIEVNAYALHRQGSSCEELLNKIEWCRYKWDPWRYADDAWQADPDPKACELYDVICTPI